MTTGLTDGASAPQDIPFSPVNLHLLLTTNLPAAMREARRWLLWRNESVNGKARKVPYYRDGSRRQGALDTEADWDRLCTFEQMLAALDTGRYTGPGFALGPDGTGRTWQGIDLDHIDERPELAALGETLPGYVETSPSGTGLHAIGYGMSFPALGSNQSGIEAYASGRYFTVTGNAARGDVDDLSVFVVGTLAPLHSPERATARQTARPVPGESFHAKVNAKALQALSAWVPALLPKARPYHDGFRVSSADLGRNLEEDLSILPAGIKDFGEEAGKTPIDLILDWGPAKDASEAALWLCSQLGIDPAALGWRGESGENHHGAKSGEQARGGEPGSRRSESGAKRGGSIDPGGVSVINAAAVKVEPVAWLWPGWLARGKIHIVAGAPGTGKTTVAMALAATVTIGGRWPDGTRATPGHVMIWSGEDDPTDTLVPRLMAAGADLSRVHLITGFVSAEGSRSFDPSRDAVVLADQIALMDTPPALLIIDPIVSAVAGDSHKNAEVRRDLQPLVDLAMLRRCAALGISHFSKGSAGQDPINRVTGSLAFGALARVVMATARLADEAGGGRILARAKSNIGPDTGGFGYDLDICEAVPGIETTRVLWGEVLEGSARDLLGMAEAQGDPEDRTATNEAKEWLQEVLSEGPMKAKDVQKEAREAGISDKALRMARERLGIKPTKGGFSAGWKWELPPEDALEDALNAEDAQRCPLGKLGHLRKKGHLRETAEKSGEHEKTDFDSTDQEVF